MKLLVDITGCLSHSQDRGIGRYSLSLSKAFIDFFSDIDVHFLINTSLPNEAKPLVLDLLSCGVVLKNIHYISHLPIRARDEESDPAYAIAHTIFSMKVQEVAPDFLLVTEHFTKGINFSELSLHGTKVGVIVYDLIPLIFPSDYLPSKQDKKWFEWRLKSLKKADVLFSISKSSQQDIRKLAGVDEVVNIGADCSSSFSRSNVAKAMEAKHLNVDKPYFLYVGGLDPRKSVDLMIEAFGDFVSMGYDFRLKIVGLRVTNIVPKLEFLIAKSGLQDRVEFVGQVSDGELIDLYVGCFAYLHASQYEGFGLPLLEAMRCGASIIAANNSSVLEVVGDAAFMFETENKQSFLSAMNLLVTDAELREKKIGLGMLQADLFSWQRSAEILVEAVRRLTNARELSSKESVVGVNYRGKVCDNLKGLNLNKIDTKELAKCVNHSFEVPFDKPQLLLDTSIIVHGDAKSGIQRVVRAIINTLYSEYTDQYEISPVYCDHDKGRFAYSRVSINDGYSFSIPETPSYVDIRRGDKFIGMDLNHHLMNSGKPIYYDVLRSKADVFFVIYDLLPVKYPEYFPEGVDQVHRVWLEELAKADGVLAISQSVLNDYSRYLNETQIDRNLNQKLRWFHLGSDLENSVPSESEGDQAAVELYRECIGSRLTIVMVGTIEPRKGYKEVFEAFELVFESKLNVNLVFVGKAGWKVDELIGRFYDSVYLDNCFFWLDGPSDFVLREVYESADGIIAASFDEGFGLPIVEAAKFEIPVLARDIPVFREVGGQGATYFSGLNANEFSDEIMAWLELIEQGLAPDSKQTKILTWSESTAQILDGIA